MKWKSAYRLSVWLFFYSFLIANVMGQGATSSAFSSTIKDSSGAIIAGAKVQIKSTETGLERENLSNESGTVFINLLPPGEYELKIEVDGFTPQIRKVLLTLGQTLSLDIELIAGGNQEIIEVNATAPILDLNKTEVSTTIDRQKIENLPINRRNFLDFSLTTPGVNIDRLPIQGPAAASGLSFNGQTPRQNNITIDGLDNNDLGSSSVRSTFSQDAVQEFQVLSNSFSAEYGRAIGGIVNIVTRSGTNDFHGSAFLFNRNQDLNARNAFARTNPQFSQYQYGFTLGGPIVKNKHFFFTSYERLDVTATNFVTISDQAISSLKRLGFPTDNGDVAFEQINNSLLISTKSQLNSKNTLSLRYNFSRGKDENLQPFGGLVARSTGGIGILRDDALAISNISVLTPKIVMETRFLYARRSQAIDSLDPNQGPLLNIFSDEGLIFAGRNTFLPQPRLQNIYQVFNSLSLSTNRQNIKFGVDLNFSDSPEDRTALPIIYGGLAVFQAIDFAQATGIPGLPSISALQNFDPTLRTPLQKAFLTTAFGTIPGFGAVGDLPLPAAFIQGFGDPSGNITSNYLSFFAQDDIKIKQNFTLKLGGRYDREGLDDPFPSTSGNHFSPRIAFTWSPLKNNKLAIHGAYGLFYGVTQRGVILATRVIDGVKTKTALLILGSPTRPGQAAINQALIKSFAQPGHRFPETGQFPSELSNTGFPVRIFLPDPNFKNPYSHQASFGFDYSITNNMALTINYQLVRGLHILLSRNINPIIRPDLGDPAGRVDPNRGDVFSFEGSGDSYYHGVSFVLNRRFANRFGGLVSYTFSKALDNFVDFQADREELQDSLNLRNERSYSSNDVPHRFVASGTLDIGYSKNIFLKDFLLSAIITINSGRPFNLLAGVDVNRNGDNPPGDRPAQVGRNLGISPKIATFDMRLTRSIRLKDKYQFNLTLEAFNLFNRVNILSLNRIYLPNSDGSFNLPPKEDGRFIATPDRFRDATSSRQLQLGVRFSF
ncbi:MAG: TonB-dependent receptor [Acidobacteria bacterium]|nr:TonB-dependent receptor [Acidobacteriota bacterium]